MSNNINYDTEEEEVSKAQTEPAEDAVENYLDCLDWAKVALKDKIEKWSEKVSFHIEWLILSSTEM